MLKAKFCSFAIACIVGLCSYHPIAVFAAEAEKEVTILSEKEKDQDKKAALEEKMIAATEKWNTLSKRQKNQIYSLIEKEMKAKFKVMDQLVEYGIIVKEDAQQLKARMQEKLNELKESGELPLPKYRVKHQK